jgi:hypothetical protein
MSPLAALFFGLSIGIALTASVFSWVRQEVIEGLSERLAHAEADAAYQRGIVRQCEYEAGKIYLSEADVDELRKMGISQ